ncbi:unnamed protein product, partial [Polarella glacialis]
MPDLRPGGEGMLDTLLARARIEQGIPKLLVKVNPEAAHNFSGKNLSEVTLKKPGSLRGHVAVLHLSAPVPPGEILLSLKLAELLELAEGDQVEILHSERAPRRDCRRSNQARPLPAAAEAAAAQGDSPPGSSRYSEPQLPDLLGTSPLPQCNLPQQMPQQLPQQQQEQLPQQLPQQERSWAQPPPLLKVSSLGSGRPAFESRGGDSSSPSSSPLERGPTSGNAVPPGEDADAEGRPGDPSVAEADLFRLSAPQPAFAAGVEGVPDRTAVSSSCPIPPQPVVREPEDPPSPAKPSALVPLRTLFTDCAGSVGPTPRSRRNTTLLRRGSATLGALCVQAREEEDTPLGPAAAEPWQPVPDHWFPPLDTGGGLERSELGVEITVEVRQWLIGASTGLQCSQ